MGMQHPHSGEWVEFEDFGVWGDHVLYNLGDPRKTQRHAGPAASTACASSPTPTCCTAARSICVFADGSVKTMTFERLGNQIAFLRCGMYGGPNGGTPDGDLWHGMKVAAGDEVVVHGETFDVNDPERPHPPGRARPAPLPRHLRRRGDLRARRALRHPLLRGGQGRRHGILAARLRSLTRARRHRPARAGRRPAPPDPPAARQPPRPTPPPSGPAGCRPSGSRAGAGRR